MKKRFTIFLTLIFVLGLIPIDITQAITQNQIDAEVQIICPDDYGNWYSGSGTIIDSKGIILTNKHVVTDKYGSIIDVCVVGFIESVNQEPNFYTGDDLNLAEVRYHTTTSSMDAAILYLENFANKVYPHVDIWNSNSDDLQLGGKVEVIGFPSIGGSTITYTSGDFSGFGSTSDGTENYIKTTAPLEHGNSGGAAYNSNGDFIGIPTMVVVGELNSISYILSIDSIKNWLSGILGVDYQQDITKYSPNVEEPQIDIHEDLTPPNAQGFDIEYEIINNHESEESLIQYSIPIDQVTESGSISKVYYYFGEDKLADPISDGESFMPQAKQNIIIPEAFLLNEEKEELYFIIRLQDDSGNISNPIIAPWEVTYMLQVGREVVLYNDAINQYHGTDKTILEKYSGLFIKNNEMIWWVSPRDKVRFIIYEPTLGISYLKEILNTWFGSSWNGLSVSTGITTSNLKQKPQNVWGHLLVEFKDDGSGFAEGTECEHGCYINPQDGKFVNLGSFVQWEDSGEEALELIQSLMVDISESEINSIEPLGIDNYVYESIQRAIEENQIPLYGFTIAQTEAGTSEVDKQQSSELTERLKGFIVLQVESNGEAYYIYPDDGLRYYLGRPSDAFDVMRALGLGASHYFITSHEIYPDSVTGKILLDVEQNGEAYYIYPEDKKAYYLGRPDDAFEIMRNLGLGITNSDLNKLPMGNL